MSKTKSLHYELCLEGAKWLRRRQNYERCKKNKPCFSQHKLCHGCRLAFKYVAVELCTVGTENTDVWGYDGYVTAVIEVKVSHSDFLADKKKWWRTQAKPELQAGNLRWYLCPEGIIKPEELPEGWGLLYWDGKQISPIVAPVENTATGHADMKILYSILRREKFPEKIYNYRGAPSTIKPQTINGIPAKEYFLKKKQEKRRERYKAILDRKKSNNNNL